MPTTITFISQKGGVGKSTLARAVAVAYAQLGLRVFLADLDHAQQTSYKWARRRQLSPAVPCQLFTDYQSAARAAHGYQLLVIDGPAFISQLTLELARHSLLVFQPVKPYLDDLEPAVLEFNSLQAAGLPPQQLVFVLNQVLNAASEQEARRYLAKTPFPVLAASLADRLSYPAAQNQGRSVAEISSPPLKAKTRHFLATLLHKITHYGH